MQLRPVVERSGRALALHTGYTRTEIRGLTLREIAEHFRKDD